MSDPSGFTSRQKVGALLLDLPRFLARMCVRGGWVRVCNRNDVLDLGDNSRGVTCEGNWSSDIHACSVFPALGRMLLTRALNDWPIEFSWGAGESTQTRVSFIIPHRGVERLPLLQLTVASILAQKDVDVECIVVEQSTSPEVTGLPFGVRHIHLPHETHPTPWRKAWAYNVGVAAARSEIVVCHDGDILVPERYAAEIVRRLTNHDVLHAQRFLFCLSKRDTDSLVSHSVASGLRAFTPERVRQNWQGGTLAIKKTAYFAVGGFDERFVDWGGEDNEFFDRCRTLSRDAYGDLPFVHLWHPTQDAKQGGHRESALKVLAERLAVPSSERIEELRRASRRKSDDLAGVSQ